MANYEHTTLIQAISFLKESSGDLLGVFWTNDEWKLTIQEALLTFGGISNFFKSDIQLHTEENKRIYNLFEDTDTENLVQIKPSLTYGDVLAWINRDLVENISVVNPTSDLFTLAGLLELIKKQYNLFQSETNLVLSQLTLNVIAQNREVILPDNVIDIVHAKFISDDYTSTVNRQDEQAIAYFDLDSLLEEYAPQYYSTVYSTENKLKLYPSPIVSGTLELLIIKSQDTSTPITVDTIINLPNNLVPYLKFGVEADIFSQDGLINDPVRMTYCRKRWDEGIQIGKVYSAILTTQANGIYINTDSFINVEVFSFDLEQTDDPPSVLGIAGFNIFEIDTLPSNIINSILISAISNAPIPVNNADFIDIEITYLKPLLNYCFHLAQMKCGAEYLSQTQNYLSEFIRLSISHNERLQLKGITYESLLRETKTQEKSEPRLVEATQ